ncbi:Ig-like domain-containing protein [Dysgonomonas sp. 511]|uniref:Ig-like domain-containing protein n=1 Tax=Dysgonomonas sp. 511 TaxID=2302930 RepID=UPI0013D617DE|nr:Ig-like domain-containing protein [Dysgonomonas sp. 511]NDV78020.1 hypothetical protein [Dysgonomonas sp. 511]
MKKIIIGFVFCLSFFLVSCSDDDNNESTNVESIKILETVNDTIYLFNGDEYRIKLQTVPANSEVKFYSTNPVSFRVNQNTGLIMTTAGGVGTVIAFAPNGDGWTKAITTVFVTEYVEKISVKAGKETRILATNGSATLSSDFVVSRFTATNKKVTYSSSDPDIVSVDANSGLIRYVSRGIAEITAKAEDEGGVVSDPITVYSGYKYVEVSRTTNGAVGTASETASGYTITRAHDGNTTNSASYCWRTTGLNSPEWLMIDLKSKKDLSQLYFKKGYNTKTMEVYYHPSDEDGITGNSEGFVQFYSYVFANSSWATVTYDIFPEVISTRYVLMRFPDTYNTYVAMNEVKFSVVE